VCRGSDVYVANKDDCDDRNPNANPAVFESCNGVDDDCDGEVDDNTLWIRDADGDGYGAVGGEERQACDQPPGFVTESGDCDDTNGVIHPDATELCDALDDDCDGDVDEGFDEDGDGHVSTACAAGDDCDDSDPDIYAGATEVCADGRDNNCFAGDDSCEHPLSESDAKISATQEDEAMARQIEVGDVDGDGSVDVLVNTLLYTISGGGGRVLYGPFAGAMAAEDVGYAARASGEMYGAGISIGIGDVNGDGYDDIELGVPFPSAAFVQFGPVTADFDLADASVHLLAPNDGFFGYGSDIGDVDGDGVEDVVVGDYYRFDEKGSVVIKLGPLMAGLDDDYDALLYGSSSELMAGSVVRAGGDVDGDGVGDIALQASAFVTGGPGSGGVIVARGPFPIALDLADADTWLLCDDVYADAGAALAQRDLDGDGLVDTLVGAPGAGLGETGNGNVYVVSGRTTGTIDLADADVVLNGYRGGEFGTSLTAGDVNGDGQADLVVGAPFELLNSGATYVFYGPLTGTLDESAAAARFLGNAPYDNAGTAVALADLDANGRMDLLIGAPLETTSAVYAGALYISMSD
jgi:hypothetical protein